MADPLRLRRRSFLAEHPFLRYFVPLVVITTLLVLIAFVLVDRSRTNEWRTEFDAEERDAIAGVGQTLTQPIVDAAGDLAILVRQSAFLEMSLDPTDAELDAATEIFLGLSGVRRVYDQIRFIDMDGVERARVDLRAGVPVRVTNLQDKSGRYYVTNSIDLPQGAIYISPLDLNVENGKIEQPFKPMIRLASPVFAADGTQRGIVVLNYLGDIALDALRTDAQAIDSTFHLTNEQGYWLIAPNADDEWGFMFDDPERAIASLDPAAWDRLQASEPGQFETPAGLYTFSHLSPLEEIAAFLPSVTTDEDRTLQWTAYSFVPSAALASGGDAVTREVLGLAIAALVVLWISSAIAARALATQWESRFARQEAEFVFNASMEGIAVAGADLRTMAINPAYSEITGYAESEVLGHPLPVLASPFHDAHFYRALHERLRAEGRWQGRVEGRRADGSVIVQSLSLSVITDERGDPERYVCVITDATDLVRRERELLERATHDQLTGLANRPLLEASLERALAASRRGAGTVAVCFVDLDGFKDVNDTLGHAAGDEVLREVAARLSSVARDADTLARFGGDEFVLVMSDVGRRTDIDGAAHRLLTALRTPIETHAGAATVRGSMGLAANDRMPDLDPETLLTLADAAMYRAKQSGGDRACWSADAWQPSGTPAESVASVASGGSVASDPSVPIIDLDPHLH